MNPHRQEATLKLLAGGTQKEPVPLGRYDIVGRVGRGGMGTVYRAVDRERKAMVALKTLSVADTSASMWLKNEFRVVADLTHPHLAAVYELASEDDVWFFTMELVDGVTLMEWARGQSDDVVDPMSAGASSGLPAHTVVSTGDLGSTRANTRTDPDAHAHLAAGGPTRPMSEPTEPMAPPFDMAPASSPEVVDISLFNGASPPIVAMERVRSVFGQLASGLAALHAAGLRHGDVKPANALVRRDGRAVLVDFGLASPVEESHEFRLSSGGTPAYMPPEQLSGHSLGPEVDWYALGATLYHVLTGVLPFQAPGKRELYAQKLQQMPPAPHELVPSVPRDVGELCQTLLHPDPKHRPSGAEIFAALTGPSEANAGPESLSDRRRQRQFFGRETELYALEQAYGQARGGVPVVVHTSGPSGIGKSSLLTSFLRSVSDVDAALVLRGRCYERESVPYKGFDRIVDQLAEHLRKQTPARVQELLPTWTPELVAVFPALGTVHAVHRQVQRAPHAAHDPLERRRRAWSALSELLAAMPGPIVLAIDDLQWADVDTAQLLSHLLTHRLTADPSVGAAPKTPWLFVLLYRPTEAGANGVLGDYFELADRLTAEGRLIDVKVGELAPDEASQLARDALESVGIEATRDRIRYVAQEARGIPFFIEELAHFVAQQGPQAVDVETSLDRAIGARVDALPEEQRALIELVAVANSPIPQSVIFEAAGVDAASLGALLALRGASLVTWLGVSPEDGVLPYHDRIRESVIGSLSDQQRGQRHLALARALAKRCDADSSSTTDPTEARAANVGWVYEATRHFAAAESLVTSPEERRSAARLHAEAGELARSTGAFPLASTAFEGGIRFLTKSSWDDCYELALRLYVGAVESAYLSADWALLDERIADIKEHARTAMDQLVAWEAAIDAHVGRHEFAKAVDTGLEALRLLGVELPVNPDESDVGASVFSALDGLTVLGPAKLRALPDLSDPRLVAATRIQVRVSPAAYFGRPMLLPVIACNLVTTSMERGVSTATPYALALFGIVLNTISKFDESHLWGQLALELLERWPDRRLETATRHILYNLVCCWKQPLSNILDPLRKVFDLGCQSGDYEYASYAAHGYSHNALYAGRALGPLLKEALDLGVQMRALGQVNAVHVHTPFEQLLKALTGALDAPQRLDERVGEQVVFDEQRALEDARAAGSRSGVFIVSVATGLARYWFDRPEEARSAFARAYEHIDAGPSVWHQPILFQFGALATCAAWERATPRERSRWSDELADKRSGTESRERGSVSLRTLVSPYMRMLQQLVDVHDINFAHRLSLVEAELLRVEGNAKAALDKLDDAVKQAQRGGWINDVALANELRAKCTEHDPAIAKRHLRAARAGYSAWGATAKANAIARAMERM